MNANRTPILLICLLLPVACWSAALFAGRPSIVPLSVAVISGLCLAGALLKLVNLWPTANRDLRRSEETGPTEFRHGLFDLCAGLRIRIRFCEDHFDLPPELLLEELEQMKENIGLFMKRAPRPVWFFQRARWPWHRL